MYCRFCGKVIRDDASFCSYCGKSAFPIAESKPQSAVLLPMRPAAHETSAAEPNSEPAGTEMVMQPTPMESVPMQPPASEHTGRANMVYNFVSVPADWQCGMNDVVRQAAIAATVSTPQKTNAPTAIPPVRTPTEERTANIAETVKEKAAQLGTITKDAAVKYGGIAKEKALQIGGAAKEHAKKLGATAKQKAKDGVGKQQTVPFKKMEKSATSLLPVVASAALFLILPTMFVPYCRIAYSSNRAANMPLWKLMFGGTYTMGSTNPLQFTTVIHPELLALLLIPLFVLLPLFLRKKRLNLRIVSGVLFAVGLTVVIWNGSVMRTIKGIVSGMSLESFEIHVKSMNGVVIKWVQSVLSNNLSFADTFTVAGRIGWVLIGLFGWIVLLLGAAGIVLCLVLSFFKKKAVLNDANTATETMPDENDDVPEL
jgi:hypothetical protein